MFSSPQAPTEFPRGHLKRYHEEGEADAGGSLTMTCEEHRNKRLHTLPLRSSPISIRRQQSPAHFQSSQTPAWSSQSLQMTPPQTFASDMDMDMMDCAGDPNAAESHLSPGPFHPDVLSADLNGRIPTPIQPSFAAQVRGNNWGGAAGNIMQPQYPGRSARSPLAADLTPAGLECLALDSTVPRTMEAMADWNLVQNRSLPSPISESGGEEMGSPNMMLDSGAPALFRRKSLDMGPIAALKSHSTMSLPLEARCDEDVEVASPATKQSWAPAPPTESAMDTDRPATPSPGKGHTRNRHTVNNWTAAQPGMKKSFSIGYRADCDKCRNKVPGHFNHIIVS